MAKSPIVLIEYFTTEDKTLIFVIRREYDEPKIEEVGIPSEELHKLVKDFRDKVETISDVDNELEQFSQYLIKPVLDKGYLKDDDYLYVVPHADLHYLPFHTLSITRSSTSRDIQIIFDPSQKQRPTRKALEKKAFSTKIYRHPFYWAPFVLIGDWK